MRKILEKWNGDELEGKEEGNGEIELWEMKASQKKSGSVSVDGVKVKEMLMFF